MPPKMPATKPQRNTGHAILRAAFVRKLATVGDCRPSSATLFTIGTGRGDAATDAATIAFAEGMRWMELVVWTRVCFFQSSSGSSPMRVSMLVNGSNGWTRA